jgi:hypothetical protein
MNHRRRLGVAEGGNMGPMELNDLLLDLFSRVGETVHGAVHGLDPETLNTAPETGSNPVGWLVWHLTRVQDHHVAEVLDEQQIWVQDGWAKRFGLDPEPDNTGYDHDLDQVAAVRPENSDAVLDYYEAVAARTRTFLQTVSATDLDRIVDRRWDPPVTLGVRLVSIADDDIQHAGQAAYARGILERR